MYSTTEFFKNDKSKLVMRNHSRQMLPFCFCQGKSFDQLLGCPAFLHNVVRLEKSKVLRRGRSGTFLPKSTDLSVDFAHFSNKNREVPSPKTQAALSTLVGNKEGRTPIKPNRNQKSGGWMQLCYFYAVLRNGDMPLRQSWFRNFRLLY